MTEFLRHNNRFMCIISSALVFVAVAGCETEGSTTNLAGEVAANESAGQYQRSNIQWRLDPEADRGAIARSGNDFVFAPSLNRGTGGVFKQRAEISSENIPTNSEITYRFSTTISMKTESSEDAIIFQVHDSRNGCAPPMSLRWKGNNVLSFNSDYTRDQGMSGCVENIALSSAPYFGPTLSRSGSKFELAVELSFDGRGGFRANVFIDDEPVISGDYDPPSDASFVNSSRFYMKHGVYSQNIWAFRMSSERLSVFRLVR